MNAKLLGELAVTAIAIAGIAACSVNSSKATSWGKEGVSMLDYQTDTLLCATVAQNVGTGNASHTAGGIDGQNPSPRTGGGSDAAVASGNSGSSGSTAQSISGGTYQGMASNDYVSRAATQQRTQEMQLKQARVEALNSCLVQRGYVEFDLTAEQRAELAKLPQGSEARRAYLYKLGTDPANIAQGKARK